MAGLGKCGTTGFCLWYIRHQFVNFPTASFHQIFKRHMNRYVSSKCFGRIFKHCYLGGSFSPESLQANGCLKVPFCDLPKAQEALVERYWSLHVVVQGSLLSCCMACSFGVWGIRFPKFSCPHRKCLERTFR